MRVANWTDKLAEVIDGSQQIEFAWGSHDCCQFAAKVVQGITGINHAEDFPPYSTEEEAFALVESRGGFDGMLTAMLGPSKHPAFAMRGDVVLCDFGRGPQPGICLGVWSVAPAAKGLAKRMTNTAVMAWGV